jgi:hypothetical protein
MRRVWWPASARSWSRRHGVRFKVLSSLFLIAACGSSSAPRPLGIDIGDVQGNWAFQLTDTAGCAGPNFEHPIIASTLVVDSSTLFLWIVTPSRWSSGALEGGVSGWFPAYAPGKASLNFSSSPPLQGFRFAGDLTGQLSLRGTVTDSVPMLSPNPCIFRARGSHN